MRLPPAGIEHGTVPRREVKRLTHAAVAGRGHSDS